MKKLNFEKSAEVAKKANSYLNDILTSDKYTQEEKDYYNPFSDYNYNKYLANKNTYMDPMSTSNQDPSTILPPSLPGEKSQSSLDESQTKILNILSTVGDKQKETDELSKIYEELNKDSYLKDIIDNPRSREGYIRGVKIDNFFNKIFPDGLEHGDPVKKLERYKELRDRATVLEKPALLILQKEAEKRISDFYKLNPGLSSFQSQNDYINRVEAGLAAWNSKISSLWDDTAMRDFYKYKALQMLIRTNNNISEAIEDRKPAGEFGSNLFENSSAIYTFGLNKAQEDFEAKRLEKNHELGVLTPEQRDYLSAYSFSKGVESIDFNQNNYWGRLGEGTAQTIGFMLPFPSIMAKGTKVGTAVFKGLTKVFGEKAGVKMASKIIGGAANIATQSLISPMTYSSAMQKWAGPIVEITDKNGEQGFLFNEKDRINYIKEASNDIERLTNEIKILSNKKPSFLESEEQIKKEIEDKTIEIENLKDSFKRIINPETGEPFKDVSLGKSYLYGLNQSARENFTETFVGPWFEKATLGARRFLRGKSKLFSKLDNVSMRINDKINNTLSQEMLAHGRHLKIWNGIGGETFEEMANQVIPAYMEDYKQNLSALSNPSFYADVIGQTAILGAVYGGINTTNHLSKYYSRNKGKREDYRDEVKKEAEYSKDLRDLYFKIGDSIKDKKEVDLIAMASPGVLFDEKDYKSKLTELKANGFEEEANYLEKKIYTNMAVRAMEMGRLDEFERVLNKASKSLSPQERIKNNNIESTLKFTQYLGELSDKFQDKVNFNKIVSLSYDKFNLENTISKLKESYTNFVNDNYEDLLSVQNLNKELLSTDLYNFQDENILKVFENIQNQSLEKNQKGVHNLKLLQDLQQNLDKVNQDFNFETSLQNYKVIQERTKRENLKRVLENATKENIKEVKKDIQREGNLNSEVNSILTSIENNGVLSKEEKESMNIPQMYIDIEDDELGLFEENNLMSPQTQSEDNKTNLKKAFVQAIKDHANTIKANEHKTKFYSLDDFTFSEFCKSLYNNVYKGDFDSFAKNFDLVVESWKEANINKTTNVDIKEAFRDISGLDAQNKIKYVKDKINEEIKKSLDEELEEEQEDKEIDIIEEQELSDEVETKQEEFEEVSKEVNTVETEELNEKKEVRRSLKIPFLGVFYNRVVDKVKGVIEKISTEQLNEESLFFINWNNLPVGKQVKVKVSNDWLNPDKIISSWETITAENGNKISDRNNITMRELVESVFDNKYKFEDIIKDQKLIKELFNNDLFISKVPVDLIVDGKTFNDKGLHDVNWWNYDTVKSNEASLLREAKQRAEANGETLSSEDIEYIKREALMEQEATIEEAQNKLLKIRKKLINNKNRELNMIVSSREIGHISQNPIKIRDGQEVKIIKDGKEIPLKALKSIKEANPTSKLCIFRNGRFEYKEGDELNFIPNSDILNFNSLQKQMIENYETSFGSGSMVMIFKVGEDKEINSENNSPILKPKYIASLVYSSSIEAQPFLNDLFNTIYYIQEALKENSLFSEGVADRLIKDLNQRYNINLRDSKQLSEFINLFPEKVREKAVEGEKRGKVVYCWEKNGILVEEGVPGATRSNKPLLRYDIKIRNNTDNKVPNIKFERDTNGKIVNYSIKEETSYAESLQKGLYTTNNFIKIEDSYFSDTQPIIILSPLNTEEKKEEKNNQETIQTDNNKEESNISEDKLKSLRETFKLKNKSFVVNNIFQKVLLSLQEDLSKSLIISEVYKKIEDEFSKTVEELNKDFKEESIILQENKEDILGFKEYEDSVREKIDLLFNKTKEKTDKLIKENGVLESLEEIEIETPEETLDAVSDESEGIKKDQSKQSFEYDFKLKLKTKVNILLSGIENSSKNINQFGNLSNFYSLGVTTSGLQYAFSLAEDNSIESLEKSIIKLLSETGEEYSDYIFLKEILKRLKDKKTPYDLVKEIQFILYQNEVQMFFLMMEDTGRGEINQVMNADNKNKDIVRRKQWENNLKQNKNLINNFGYTYSINKEEAKKLIDTFNSWKRDITKIPSKEELKNFLLSFGVNLHDKTIEDILKGNKKISYFSLIESNGFIGVLVKSLEKLQKSSKLSFNSSKNSEHLLFNDNNTNIKNLLAFDNKNVFIPAASVYIGGKTVNKYEQPCFISEQMKRLSNLDPNLIENLSSCPYTKNSFLLNYLIKSKGEDSKIEVLTTSLESLKIKGNNKKDKTGVTELSSKDYDLLLLGLFAHQGPGLKNKYSSSVNLRTSYLPFPSISDASRLPLIKTIVLDLKGADFSSLIGNRVVPNENILDIVFNQLVLPDYYRLAEVIKNNIETGREGYDFGSRIFSMLPSLNSVIIDERTLLQHLNEDLKSSDENIEKILAKYKDKIIEEIKNVLSIETEKYIKINIDSKEISGSFISQDIFDPLRMKNPIKGIDSKYLDSKEEGDLVKKMQIVAYDYVINTLLNQAQIQMLFSGDMANYFQDKKQKLFTDNSFTKFKTNTKEFLTEAANTFFPLDTNLLLYINKYFSTKNEEKQQQIYDYILENYKIEDDYCPILSPTLEDHNIVSRSLYLDLIKESTSVNLSKRLKGILSPGSKTANCKGKKILQLCIKDVNISSEILKELINTFYPDSYTEEVASIIKEFKTLDNKGNKGESEERFNELLSLLRKRFPKISDYFSMTSTDAQEITTWKEALEDLRDRGKLTEDIFNSIKEKLEEQSKDNYVPQERFELTLEEKKIIFQPSKPLHAGMYFENVNGHLAQNFVYIKSSSFPLLPSMTKQFPLLDKLRKNMERIEERTQKNVRLSFQSANKVGSLKKVKSMSYLYKDNLSEEDITKFEDSAITLDKDNYSIQQEKPYDFKEDLENNEAISNTRGTQFEKILLSNGINRIKQKVFPNLFDEEILKDLNINNEENVSGEDLDNILNHLYKKEQFLLKNKLFKSLGIKDFRDFNAGNPKLYESIANKINSQLNNYQDKQGLEVIYYVKEDGIYNPYTKEQINKWNLKVEFADFKFPTWMLPNSRKFESVLNSVINKNNINLKLPGFHSILGSQEGFEVKTEEDFNKEYKKDGVIFNPSYNGKLKATRNEETGELLGSQVFITNKFTYVKNGKREKVNLEDYLKKDEKGNNTCFLDLEKIPKELLECFSFRIPTSSHQSGCLIEIAGFLPDSYGDLMIVSADYTVQIGEDYDIDTRNVYNLNIYEKEDENGNKTLERINYSYLNSLNLNEREKNDMEIDIIQNNISSLYKSVFSSPSINVLKKIREKLSTDTVAETANKIYEKIKEKDFTSFFSPSFQKEMLRSGATGKMGIAIHSNWLSFTGLLQQMKHPIKLKDFDLTFGILKTDGTLNNINSLNEERSISSYHMENQNTSTDNQKLLYMAKRNENEFTINVLALMTTLGLNKDKLKVDNTELSYSSLFISQPIIRDYCKLMEYYSSISTENYENVEDKVKGELIKKYGKDLSWKRDKLNNEVIGKLNNSIKSEKEKELTSPNLFSNLKSSSDNIFQWTVYEHFLSLKEKAKHINDLIRFFNIENKGMGISYFNTIELKDFLSNIIDLDKKSVDVETIEEFYIEGIKDMIGDFKRVKKGEENLLDKDYIFISSNEKESLFIKPTTYFGHKIVNSISLGYNLWKDIFPYESIYVKNIINSIVENSNIKSTQDILDLKYKIISSLKDFSYTFNNNLFKDNIEDIRRNLFIDTKENTSLAGYLNYLQKINHPLMREPFFNQLEMKIGGTGLPSIVIYNSNSTSKFEKNEIKKVFDYLLNNKEKLPNDQNNKEYTFESLGKSLLQYSLLSNQENGAIGFRHLFPFSFFDKYGVTENIRVIGNTRNITTHNILFNGPVKSLELLLDSKIKNGFIENKNNINNSKILVYIDHINKIAGKEIAFEDIDGVRISINDEQNSSRFITQFFQHNPEYTGRMKRDDKKYLLRIYNTKNFSEINSFNFDDVSISRDYVYVKDTDGKIILYKLNGNKYEKLNKIGSFGLNEYNYNSDTITESLDSDNLLVYKQNNNLTPTSINPFINNRLDTEDIPQPISLKNILESIIKSNSKYSNVAKSFLPFMDTDTKIEIVEDLQVNGIKANGVYSPSINLIKIDSNIYKKDPNFTEDSAIVILEEYLHSLTKNTLKKYVKFSFLESQEQLKLKYNISSDAPSSILRLCRVYQSAFEEIIKEKGKDEVKNLLNKLSNNNKEKVTPLTIGEMESYRISSIDEFIAGIFFDNNFRDLVGNKEYMQSGKTLLESWIQSLINLLQQVYTKFHENTIGKETIDSLYNFLNETHPTHYKEAIVIKEDELFDIEDDPSLDLIKEDEIQNNITEKEEKQKVSLEEQSNKERIFDILLKDGQIENQGFTLTLEDFLNMTKEEQDNFIKCL